MWYSWIHIEFVGLKMKSAREVIQNLKFIFFKHGIPEVMVCDNVRFASAELKTFPNDYCFDIVTEAPIIHSLTHLEKKV